MELQLGILADGANVDSDNKLYIMGEFRYLNVEKLPAFHPHMALVLRFAAPTVEVPNGTAKMKLQFVDADGAKLMPVEFPELAIQFAPVGPADRGISSAQVVLNMALPISQEGDHVIHVWVDNHRIGEVKFHVLKRAPRRAAPPA